MSTVTIRAYRDIDADEIYRMVQNPSVMQETTLTPYQSVDLFKQSLLKQDEHKYIMVAYEFDKIVGCISLLPNTKPRLRHSGTFWIIVTPDYQGKGVGSQLMQCMLDIADNWLNLIRVELTVFAENPKAIALYKKFGFEIEGTYRKATFRQGRYADAYHMARLRDND